MRVETLGQAYAMSWRVHVRCAYGPMDGMKSIRECRFSAELDVETFVCTRGRDFPLARLSERLRCPRCGSRLPSERPQALRRQQALGQQYLAVLRYYRSQNRLVVVDRLDPDALQADLQRRLDRPAGL